MELGNGWLELGLAGLFLASFLAATVLPFSSELVLLGMATAGWPPLELLVSASAGNWLGGMSSYALGRLGDPDRLLRWLKVDVKKAGRWRSSVARYGPLAALACWLPVVGDLVAVALGLGRSSLVPTAFLMLVGKAARYAVLLVPFS
ncbi:MAG: VTT domain-containing protein [Flavobacteriales bacterium]